MLKGDRERESESPQEGQSQLLEEEAVSMASDSSALPRVTFQTPEKHGEESSHRKLGKLTIKYNRKDLQRWLDLEEWINSQLQQLYQCRVSHWGKPAPLSSALCLLHLAGNSFSFSVFTRSLIATCYSTVSAWCVCKSEKFAPKSPN